MPAERARGGAAFTRAPAADRPEQEPWKANQSGQAQPPRERMKLL